MKKIIIFIITSYTLLFSCVAKKPYRFALYWQSIREQENNPLIGKRYWVKNTYIKVSKKPLKKTGIKIPKFTQMEFTRLGVFRKYIKGKIRRYTIVEYKIIKKSPLKSAYYNAMKKNIAPGEFYYVDYRGNKRQLVKRFKKKFLYYNPVTTFNLKPDELESISNNEVKVNQREPLLLLTYGKPESAIIEKIRGIVYKRYFFEEHGFFYIYGGIVRMKSKNPIRVK